MRASERRLLIAIEMSSNHDALDFRGSFVNLGNLRIAEQPLDGIVLHVAVATEYLNGLSGHLRGRFRSPQLGHGAVCGSALAAVVGSCCRIQRGTGRRYAGCHVCKLELDCLEVA